MQAQAGDSLRRLLRRTRERLRLWSRPSIAGRFQPYAYTLPDRYPWLFGFSREALSAIGAPNLLTFGCSTGAEAFTLRQYFPTATIKGVDIDPRNISRCTSAAEAKDDERLSFAVAATTAAEPSAHYDAIYCLAVLCHGDLINSGAGRCDPLLYFADFERQTEDFARCLKPGGLLFLHSTHFRFGDTAAAAGFDTVLSAEPSQLGPNILFDRDNQLLAGALYRPVGFRKRGDLGR